MLGLELVDFHDVKPRGATEPAARPLELNRGAEYSAPPHAIKGAGTVVDRTKSKASARLLRAAAKVAIVASLSAASWRRCVAAEPIVLHGQTMGTTYNIRCWSSAAEQPTPPADLQRSIDALLDEFDKQMSSWRDDSEVSRFNAAPAGEWFQVSAATAEVVARALELHHDTGGALDITVAPLLRLWGFGPQARAHAFKIKAPSTEALEATRRRVGADKVSVRSDPPALRKSSEGVEVDLASLAPGYAVDLMIERLAARGVDNAMIEVGGEVRGWPSTRRPPVARRRRSAPTARWYDRRGRAPR